MNTEVANPSVTETVATPATPAQGTKAPQAGDVKAAIAATLRADEMKLAELQARIVVLEANQKEPVIKKAVSDSDLDKAISALEGKNRNDVSKLQLSLAKELGFIPDFTATQKTEWKTRRQAMEKAYSAHWKGQSAVVIGHLRRAVKNPKALMGGRIATRKTDNAVTSVALRAKGLAKPLKVKGKGKGAAKPANVTGNAGAKKGTAHAEASANPATIK